jgi:hypothetical protein
VQYLLQKVTGRSLKFCAMFSSFMPHSPSLPIVPLVLTCPFTPYATLTSWRQRRQSKKKEDYEGAFDAMHELLRLYQCVCPENQQLLHPYIASGSAPNSMLEGQVPDYGFSG